MDITITGRNVGITDRFRGYATEKSAKVEHLADRALALEIKLCRHHETHGATGDDRVELTLIGPGPIIRAEAGASDKYAAFDTALGKLLERLRRAKDRTKVHRGQHRPETLRETRGSEFLVADLTPADTDTLIRLDPDAARRAHGAGPILQEPPLETAAGTDITQEVLAEDADDEYAEYNPVVIRKKVFASVPMNVDDALYYMELVGHDFYLFIDAETSRPSVVYRRMGWDYGVIALDDDAPELQEVATATRKITG